MKIFAPKLSIVLLGLCLLQSCGFLGFSNQSVSRYSGDWSPADSANISEKQIEISYKGKTYSINKSFDGDSGFEYGMDNDLERHALLAVDGKNVKAILLYGTDDVVAIGLEGTNTSFRPAGSVKYQGEFRFVSAKDTYLSNQSQPVEIKVDFDDGVLKGSSISHDYFAYETQFRGILKEDYIEIIFNDETGIHHGKGDFFGKNGEELFAYYTAAEHGGILYANQD